MNDMVRIPAARLRELSHAALQAAGVPAEDARAGGDILWTGEMMGISTHGVRRLIFYIQRIRDGAIAPRPDLRIEQPGAGTVVIDGGNGLGPVVGSRGVAEALRVARETGIGFVTCRNSHHFGPVAPYALRAVQAGMVAIMGTNAQPVMSPWRGATVTHGNNPIAFAAPRRNGPPFIIDVAQSVVAYSKLRHAHEAGEPIPQGWAADADGKPTTDAEAGMKGFVLPIGGHKGYGFALGVEILAAALSGGAIGAEVKALYRRDATPQGVCHFFIVIDPERTIGREPFLDRMDAMCSMMSAVAPIDPAEPVLIPGEPEARAMDDRERNGVPLPRDWIEDIEAMAAGRTPKGMPER